jgi:sigma-B regulation protein RsbU (phosphoserine phosphatase)
VAPPANGIDSEHWRELLRLAGESRGDHQLLDELLAAFCDAVGASGAAVYQRRDGDLRQEQSFGADGFPARLSDEPEPGLGMLSLPGGALAFRNAEREAAVDQVVLLIASTLQVRELRRRLKRQGFEANLRGVELEALYDVGLAIASTLNLEELAEEILLRAISLLDARRGALFLINGDVLDLERTIGGDAIEHIESADPSITALLERETLEEQTLLPGASYLLGAAIEVEGRRRGLIVVADKESRTGVGPFGDAARRTLELFANQAAIALENARLHLEALEKERLEREMELAAQIQTRLLPTTVPQVSGFEILGWSRPARHVGGDYYDLIALKEGSWGLVVGDVSGKGMPAALMVSTVHSALRLLLDQLEVGPALLERLNRHISETSAPNKFITFFMAEVDSDEGAVHFINAGHNPALLVGSSGEPLELKTGGLPLGLLSDSVYEDGDFRMEPGDLLCIYSDGITEAISQADEEFGTERLIEVLNRYREEPLPSVIAAIDRATADFARGMPQFDDQTLLLLRRLPL